MPRRKCCREGFFEAIRPGALVLILENARAACDTDVGEGAIAAGWDPQMAGLVGQTGEVVDDERYTYLRRVKFDGGRLFYYPPSCLKVAG